MSSPSILNQKHILELKSYGNIVATQKFVIIKNIHPKELARFKLPPKPLYTQSPLILNALYIPNQILFRRLPFLCHTPFLQKDKILMFAPKEEQILNRNLHNCHMNLSSTHLLITPFALTPSYWTNGGCQM